MVVASLAIAGAFASNLSHQDNTIALGDKIGYRLQGAVCVPTSTMCTTNISPHLCQIGASTLFEWNGTDCPNALYRK